MPEKEYWELNVKTVKLSRSGDGSFGISIEGGADKGQFGSVGCVRETVIVAQGDISPGDIVLQVNGDAVGGFIHWDLLSEIRRSGSLLTLLLVPQGKGLPLELSDFLVQKFDEESEDFKLQKVVRHNIYNKTLPYTTRPPRVDEKPGLDYIFVSEEEFNELEEKGVLLEKGSYGGHMYGTPRPEPYDPNMHNQGGGRQLGPRQVGKLPPGWETAYTQYGQKYFINHNDGSTTWSDPRLVALQYHSAKTSKFGELPYGWEEIQNDNGVYYIDYINKRTTTQHPSTLPNLQHPPNETMLSGYGSPVQAPGRIVTATLYKTTKGFGFTLSGGDKSGQPVLIKSVKQGSPADTQGGLLAGDILVKVNGQIVSNLTHSGVVQLFKAIPNGAEARLELRRNDIPGHNHQPQPYQPHQQQQPFQQQPYQQQPYQQQPYQQQPVPYQQQPPFQQPPFQQQPYTNGRAQGYPDQGAESSSSRSTGSVNNPHGDLIPIYIDKGDNGFGFTIHQSNAGQRIKTVMDRSRCAYLMEGDLIVQINSEPLANKSHGETVHLLKGIPPHTRTLLLVSRADPETKRKDKKNRSFRSRQPPPPPPPPQPLPPQPLLPHNNHVMTSSRANPPQINPLTQPRMPLTVPVYGMDSNRISDHGSVQSGSDRQHHQLWESPVRSAGSGGWDPITQFNQGAHSWDSTGEYQDVQVNLQKDNNGFGFKVIGGEEQGIPVAIGHVTPEGPAEGLLQIYDEIRTVNGQSVLGAYHTGVLSLIGQAASFQGKISLVVRRHKNPELLFNVSGLQPPADINVDLSRYKLVNMRNVTLTKEPEDGFGFVIHSSLRAEDTFKIGKVVAGSPAGRCADLLEGDSVITVNGTVITGLQHRTVVELIKKCGTSVVLGVGTPQLVEEDEDSEWRNQTEELAIALERDERGFGFSIRGGKAFEEEDTLFVLRIGKGGVADRDGRLRRGDEIIEINGQSMYEVSHQEAVDKIKSGGSTLNLVIRRRKLEMPPIIQLGLEDKPEVLQYPDRTEIISDSRSKNGDTPEKDPTPSSSPIPLHIDTPTEPSMDQVTRDELPASPVETAPSHDETEQSRDVITPQSHDVITPQSRDVITPRDARHEYDKYEPDCELSAGSSPVD
ncbi:membrane-associated guanylate kinase, WW and PDZ domain-containing protein 1-like isoform X2 [Bolinopsis microptera]|uniref:membrane-associated guanylate kinase, WW and PDZ domain-containing protein 1-like isoform X2 n=1 Tax=Bolinopsis microptera TaxID=2820187 RepID=UPI003078FA1B